MDAMFAGSSLHLQTARLRSWAPCQNSVAIGLCKPSHCYRANFGTTFRGKVCNFRKRLLTASSTEKHKGDEKAAVAIECRAGNKDALDPSSSESNCPDFAKWEVPWDLSTVIFTMIACGLSYVFTALIGTCVALYIRLWKPELRPEEMPEMLLLYQLIGAIAIIGTVFGITDNFKPLPDNIFYYSLEDPLNLKSGWLLWAGVGLVAAVLVVVIAGGCLTLVPGMSSQNEGNAAAELLPFIGRSPISTACLVGAVGFLGPLVEETLFRGFLMVSLTQWLPMPIAVLLSAGLFAAAHFSLEEFPYTFIFGTVLGFSYAHTRNLLTPIIIHAIWNSGVVMLLTILQVSGAEVQSGCAEFQTLKLLKPLSCANLLSI